MELWFIRHGQTDWNVEGKLQGTADIPLNDVGVAQAMQCAEALKAEPIDAVITSPLQRAAKTAHIIAQALQLTPIVNAEWRERHFGVVEGMTMDERNAKYPSFDYPEAEPFIDLQARIYRALAETEALAVERAIVVSHGAVINALIALLSNGEHGTGKTRLSNGGMTKIRKTADGWTLLTINDETYLQQQMK